MSRILEKLADQHEERMINVLYKLEDDVIKGSYKSHKRAVSISKTSYTITAQTKTS